MYRTVRTVVWEVENSSSRGIFSYSIAKFFSKHRKSRDIPGTSANQTRRLLLTADQLFHRIQKGLPDVVCFLGCLWKQLSAHTNMALHLLLLCFFAKSMLPNFGSKKKNVWKRHPFGIKFRKVYIFFLFYFRNFGGSLPASSSASARCTDIKKGTHSLLFFLPAMLIIIRKFIKKSGI